MFQLPPLPYALDALEPTMSALTLRTHHDKHHARYVAATNALVAQLKRRPSSLEDVVRAADAADDARLFNNAAQAWNHAFFWSCMTPRQTRPSAVLLEAIAEAFGDLEGLGGRFAAEGGAHFGSGWVWLVADGDSVSIVTTHDGDTPIRRRCVPLLACDLWEHAYYLDYRNDRSAFLSAWWGVVDWTFASAQYDAARGVGRAWRYRDAEANEYAAC
jgi:Fe-Mn family superoxide dismutase